MLNQAANRIKSLLARGIIHLVNDENGRQYHQLTILEGETKDNVESAQQFGWTGNPPKGSTAFVGFLGADRNRPLILGVNDPATRKKNLKSGESAGYDAFGQFIYLKEDGSIEIKTNGLLKIQADSLECSGDIIDNAATNTVSVREMREIYDGHDHTGDDGGNTSDPHQLMDGGS